MGSSQLMRAIALVGGLGAAVLTTGCDGFQSPEMFTTALMSVSESNQIAAANTPQCVLDYADYQLDENLIDFEITDTTGVNFGFNFETGFLKAIGLNVQTSKGQMQMTMGLSDSTDPLDSLANANGLATATDSSFSFNLDVLLFSGGISNSSNTPVTTLMGKTIGNGLTNLAATMSKVASPWSSPVVYLMGPTKQMIIPAGSIAGIRLGDQFQVFNMDYIWKGDPCNSQLQFAEKTTASPVAMVQVVQLEENAALLQVYDQISTDDADAIVLGSRVYVQNLPLAKGEKSRTLKHSVHIRNVVSEPLVMTTGTSIDMTKYISAETLTIMGNYGYYPR